MDPEFGRTCCKTDNTCCFVAAFAGTDTTGLGFVAEACAGEDEVVDWGADGAEDGAVADAD